jgi:hypothetical protein
MEIFERSKPLSTQNQQNLKIIKLIPIIIMEYEKLTVIAKILINFPIISVKLLLLPVITQKLISFSYTENKI